VRNVPLVVAKPKAASTTQGGGRTIRYDANGKRIGG
jgi:hypothetical protein